LMYENVAYDPRWVAGRNAEEFASLKLQLYNQISAGAPKSRRHLGGSWHFCPITRLNKLYLFPGTFRRENGLLGYSIRSFLELTSANRREGCDHGPITLGFCGEFSGSTCHPAAPSKSDNR
jgi:hypothetical protein